MWVRTALVCLATLLPACATAPWRQERVPVPPAELLAGVPLGSPKEPAALVDGAQVLAVSPEMRAFLEEHVSAGGGGVVRLRQLAEAIIHGREFRLDYDETTRTASATFHARRGNCLSFSSMFVALARELGLRASYQEVDTPPDWSFRDDSFVLNRHVNVVVDLGKESEHVVDFNMADFRSSYDRRRITDARALAHFFNNLAVERMRADDTASALAYFRKAAESDPSFSPTWTNLGILYKREGHPGYAEAAELQALRVDPSDLVAMSNLAGLYQQQGRPGRAAEYRRRVSDHRNRNPYYRFQLAGQAFRAGDYDGAIRYLKDAIRRKANEDQFYFLLGVCYLKKGDERAARRWLSRAREVAATDALKRRYASKLDILLPGRKRDEP